jgi:hypothetical protein
MVSGNFPLWQRVGQKIKRLPQEPMSKSKKPRYSIGEWYGKDLEKIPAATRRAWARRELAAEDLAGVACPFRFGAKCNKKGGVCSLRLYEQTDAGTVAGTGSPVATCPNRFLEDNLIYQWAGEVVLKNARPVVLSEVGFLKPLQPLNVEKSGRAHEFVGKIDNVLLHPDREELDWCALEIQAVYFSGKEMGHEFSLLKNHAGERLPFPAGQRRPDWRSSGPKRLLPQLQTKVPTISRWGKKMAVVVDEPFFESLVGLNPVGELSNSEIVWLVVGYEETATGWKLCRKREVLTTLESSVKALTGGTPLSKEDFERQLLAQRPQIIL